MQALVLVGGEGTRLRPLTSTMPKPVVPLVDRPFIVYQLQWLRSHGVDEVVLACGFLPDEMKAVVGDGSEFGVKLTYLVEPHPLGTGGALKYAEDLLQNRFLMLNGDTLTDIDLTAQIAQHDASGARATLALVPVEDPSAYGLVPLNDDRSVREFLEKPGPDEVIDTNLINAGAYVLEKSILAEMAPAGTNVTSSSGMSAPRSGHRSPPLTASSSPTRRSKAGWWRHQSSAPAVRSPQARSSVAARCSDGTSRSAKTLGSATPFCLTESASAPTRRSPVRCWRPAL